jgi:hypothetical protein
MLHADTLSSRFTKTGFTLAHTRHVRADRRRDLLRWSCDPGRAAVLPQSRMRASEGRQQSLLRSEDAPAPAESVHV